jgi:HAE1 family hydrophobic/amphiphilic exporter-1
LDRITKDLQVYLKDIPGVINIDSSLREAPADYTFTLDPNKLSAYGLNAAQVGSVLRTAISGTEISTVLKNNDEFKIIARFEDAQVANLDALGDLQVMNAQGKAIYLKDVATIELKPSINAITRIDQKRVVLLTSGVDTSTKPAKVLAAFKDVVAKKYQLPSGYEIVYGGENEQNTESVMSILRALVIAMILIVVTMVVQFNSFRQAMIVLVTLPLALIGVFVGMALFQVPLSFPGLIGILALFGIVVKNAIILIDKMNLNIKSGMHFDEAIVDAGNSRIEAIIITSVCTILGIIPITLSNALWQALGSAVIFGLVFSSFLTLFIVPVLYYMLMKKKDIEEKNIPTGKNVV